MPDKADVKIYITNILFNVDDRIVSRWFLRRKWEEEKMNELQIFNNPELGDVRVIGDFENPRFCLSDVCRILELPQVAKAVQRLGDEVLSRHPIADSMGRIEERHVADLRTSTPDSFTTLRGRGQWQTINHKN